jgi:Zn-dependent M32 family carboxypeptidase
VPGDNRITVRFDANNIRFAVMATLHESGHALYEAECDFFLIASFFVLIVP